MRSITAVEANRQFSKVLREVAKGETYSVISRGRPVATIIPADTLYSVRDKAKKALLARLFAQEITDKRGWTRDELYDSSL